MATPLSKVYDAFLAKIEADDWILNEDVEIARQDWQMLLDAAIFQVRYSRIPLEYQGENFTNDLTNDEIQVLSHLMRLGWIERTISTWDSIRALYSSKDFSQANYLDKLNKTAAQARADCRYMIDRYYRSTNYKPDELFSQLAGK